MSDPWRRLQTIKTTMTLKMVEAPNATRLVNVKFMGKVMAKLGTDDSDAAAAVAAVGALLTDTVVVERSKTDKEERATVAGTRVTTRAGLVKMATKTDNMTAIRTDTVKTATRIVETTVTDITAMATLVTATNRMKMVVVTDTTTTRATKAVSRAAAEEDLVAELAVRRVPLAHSTHVNQKKWNS